METKSQLTQNNFSLFINCIITGRLFFCSYIAITIQAAYILHVLRDLLIRGMIPIQRFLSTTSMRLRVHQYVRNVSENSVHFMSRHQFIVTYSGFFLVYITFNDTENREIYSNNVLESHNNFLVSLKQQIIL